MAPQLPPSFQFSFTLRPKNEKPLTAKKLPPYCITAEQIPPYFGLPLPPKSLPPKNEKPPTACKLCFEFSFTLRPKNEKPLTVPPKNYRRIALPPNKYRHILVYRFRQSRYRRKMKNRLPPANYRRMAIPPRLCPPKKPLPTTTLKITSACSYEFQFIDVFLCKTI